MPRKQAMGTQSRVGGGVQVGWFPANYSYGKINHRLVDMSSYWDVKSGLRHAIKTALKKSS